MQILKTIDDFTVLYLGTAANRSQKCATLIGSVVREVNKPLIDRVLLPIEESVTLILDDHKRSHQHIGHMVKHTCPSDQWPRPIVLYRFTAKARQSRYRAHAVIASRVASSSVENGSTHREQND